MIAILVDDLHNRLRCDDDNIDDDNIDDDDCIQWRCFFLVEGFSFSFMILLKLLLLLYFVFCIICIGIYLRTYWFHFVVVVVVVTMLFTVNYCCPLSVVGCPSSFVWFVVCGLRLIRRFVIHDSRFIREFWLNHWYKLLTW